jgi:type VI secretion system protein ImpJ
MKQPGKVLWFEGLNLSPHQFQRQDQYHEARLHSISSALSPRLWGVRLLEWDLDGLRDNVLRTTSMSLVFQDGEIYDAPDTDALPAPFDLGSLASDEETFTFHIALPLLKDHGGNFSAGDGFLASARYAQQERDTADLFNDEALGVSISYLYKTAHLLPPHQPRDAFICFPVVRLRRISGGGFEIDRSFIPPSLSIGASGRLPAMLDSLMAKLRAKLDALYAVHREPSKHAMEVHGGDIASFWMLHTISTACAQLGHYVIFRDHHPERLYIALLSLAGGLMSFSRKFALSDLPAYEHADPGHSFGRLDALIRDLVDTVISSKYFTIALAKDIDQASCRQGKFDSTLVDMQTLLCLAVSADMPGLELVAGVPDWLKVGSPDDVERMVKSALPGVKLRHMPQVPAALPVRPNTFYFALDSHGAQYANMLKAQTIRIYVPATIAGITLELSGLTA